jgi:ABC-type polysaccharide/polyol phosphate transport system ATPase subunit
MDNDLAIRLSHIDKSFKLPHEKQNTLKGMVINFGKQGYETQHVLRGLNIDVRKGEFLGILGRNGSGKSTLLKTLSGIYTPDHGTVEINGKLTPFIELGVGFNPELSGRDNVFLNGALLGFSRTEVNEIYDEIVAFAELERFMDQKLKNYSSGMQVRLAFSIAIRANTDVLVLDEVLAVGDEAFQRKCYDYFNELKQKGKTVVLVTHDMSAVQRFCTRAIVLSKGKVIYDGDTESATDVYRGLNFESTNNAAKKSSRRRQSSDRNISITSKITDLKITDPEGVEKALFKPAEEFVIESSVTFKEDMANPSILLTFNNPGGMILSALDTHLASQKLKPVKAGQTVTIKWRLNGVYNDGKYLVSVLVRDALTQEESSRLDDGCEFNVIGWDMPNVLLHPKLRYSIEVVN